MAEIFPDEGLDYILGVIPKAATPPVNTYLGLFTGGSATTVPTNAATLASMTGTFAEVTTGASPTGWPAYARQAILSASGWGAQGVQTLWGNPAGRGVVGPQVAFTTPAAVYTPTNPLNGFFLASAVTAGVALWYSNFTDTTSISTLAIGDIVKITPTWGMTG